MQILLIDKVVIKTQSYPHWNLIILDFHHYQLMVEKGNNPYLFLVVVSLCYLIIENVFDKMISFDNPKEQIM